MAHIQTEFPKCVPLTGTHQKRWTTPLSRLVDGIGIAAGDVPKFESWLIFIRMKSEHAFLTLRSDEASHILRDGDNARTTARSAYAKSGRGTLNPVALADEWYVLSCAKPVAGKDITLRLVVDTGHDLFRAQTANGPLATIAVDLMIDVIGNIAKTTEVRSTTSPTTLTINIPLGQLEPFHGVVAIDFGNTNSTMVASDEGVGRSALIPCDSVLVDIFPPLELGEAMREARPVPTSLDLLKRVEGQDGLFSYMGSYGTKANLTEQSSRLLTGAKRMLSDLPKQESHDNMLSIVVGDEVVRVPAQEPAEFFISKLFEAFLFYYKKKPTRVALTCPSTFTESEAKRLRGTAVNALRRALREPPLCLEDAAAETGESPVRALLDESTAAAFHFIDREVLQRSGGVAEFMYLYPLGMNVLIYDCGGGTTDISLVRISHVRTTELNVNVLGRVGHRTFGGDFITRQYYRILKYELARAREGWPRPESTIRAEIERREKSGDTDRLCPTRFARHAPNSPDVQRRREIAIALWRLAERIKCIPPDGDRDLLRAVDAFMRREVDGAKIENILEVSRDSVAWRPRESWLQELIIPAIDETIHYANQLVASSLSSIADVPQEIHRVYVVGNASRFPLIRRRMLDSEYGLRMRFLAERFRDVQGGLEPEELKNCVAKGAALSLGLERQGQLKVHWDKEVMRKLAFDIVHESETEVYPRVLFPIGAMMTALGHAEIVIHDDKADRIFLRRRWPGESAPENYLVFRFGNPMKPGRYLIMYDTREARFRACAEKSKADFVWGEPEVPAPYVAPAQSGEI
jgi:hypothetical protein